MFGGIYLQRYQRLCGVSAMKRKVVKRVLSLNTQRGVDASIFDILIGTAIMILQSGTHFVLDYWQEHFTFYIYAFYIPNCLCLHFAFYILCS